MLVISFDPFSSLCRYHTVVLLKDSGRMLTFGLNKSGQLGCGTVSKLITHPSVVTGNWLPHESLNDMKQGSLVDRGSVVKEIFAGGNQSYAAIYVPSKIQESVSDDSFCALIYCS